MSSRSHLVSALLVGFMIFHAINAHAASPSTAMEIMEKASDVDLGDNASSKVSLSVTSPKGDMRTHELVSFRKKFGNNERRSIMFYTFPLTMKNVGYFSIDFKDPETNDQHWMYTPTIQKMRRIGSNRLAIMNSDFSYADMSAHNAHDYHYTSLKEDVLEGKKIWIIEGIPIERKIEDDDGEYAKSVFYVRQDNYIIIRSINFLKKGNKVKQMDVTNLNLIDGIWVPEQVTMVTSKDSQEISRTIMKSSDVKFNQTFNENFFTQRQLTHGYE